jgi:2-methylcitrate dehydratase PrpD
LLLQLNTEQFGHAMGLAASQAGGLKANFGTMTKPFHAGHAAERGLLSARLAARGFTANPDAFSGSQGLVEAAGIGTLDERRLAATDDHWLIRDTLFKYHAACYLTHAAIESCLQLHTAVDSSDLCTATVTVHPSLLDVCAIPQPRTGLEAKFSLTGTTAMALLGFDTASPATFVDSIVQQPTLQEMIGKVAVETDPALRSTQTVVELEDKSQNAFRAEFDSGVPATDLEEQGRKLAAKFDAIALPALGDDAVRFRAGLESLPELPDVRQLH